MGRRINCGRYWTLLSTECWLNDDCNKCVYLRYCKTCLQDDEKSFVIKDVVDQLFQKYNEPPQKLIEEAIDQQKNPIIRKVEKKEELEYYEFMGEF